MSCIKVYSKLAAKAGTISHQESILIQSITGYSSKDGKHIDEKRDITRIGRKKAKWTSLSKSQVDQLKQQPDTPQGRRDTVIVCILADLGLRCGELALLTTDNFDLQSGEVTFYRPKVDLEQTHELSRDCRQALTVYMEKDKPDSLLLRGSRKDGSLTDEGMSTQSINDRVKILGQRIGVDNLSPHDLRHYWATQAARNGTQIDRLQQAGGWTSPSMALRYIEDSQIANEGVNL